MTILCIATYLKGEEFLRECRRLGCRVLLLTVDTLANAEWPREAIDQIWSIPRASTDAQTCRAVAAIARHERIDRIAALDDFDVETAGMLREFLQVPGFGRTVSARFRDKLAMRTAARRLGLRVPAFTGVFNDDDVNAWTARVPPPWVLKPRSAAAAIGIKKVADRDALWSALHTAGDERDACVLEAFVSGEVFHVDSIVRHDEVVFAVASKYGRPPMQIAHDGGVFTTRRLSDDSPDAKALFDANRRLLTGFGLQDGVSHSEFIGSPDGPALSEVEGPAPSEVEEFTFLETSARVGGAYIVDVIEAATGVNLWCEWARLEIAREDGEYVVPTPRRDSAGIALCLARQEHPDLSPYRDPEIVTRIQKPHHAGLIVRSPDPARVASLIDDYADRFSRDFLATLPAPDRPAQ